MKSVRLLLSTVLLGVVLLLAGPAPPAAAHAVVVDSSPRDGQVLASPPVQVRVEFNEPVTAALGGLTVLDSEGRPVDLGDSGTDLTGRILTVGLRGGLGIGTYVANYRVISADGHPVSGAIVFGVGTDIAPDAATTAMLADTGSPGFEAAGAVARFVTYAAALLAAGLALFLAFLHDQHRDRWRFTPLVRLATLLAAMGAIATIAVQAALATGRGFESMTDVPTLRAVLGDGLGWASIALLVGLALVHLSTDTNRLLWAQAASCYGWIAVSVSFVFWGHTTSAPNRVIAVVADAVHLLAASAWFGGLVALALLLERRGRSGEPLVEDTSTPSRPRPGSIESTALVVARFSKMASFALVALALTGVALASQTVGSLPALVETTYGRLLLAKLVLTAAVVGLGFYNRRRLVPRVATEEGSWSRLGRNVGIETLGVVAILAVTAVLVNVTPARTAIAEVSGGVFDQTQRFDPAVGFDGGVNLVVTPGETGPNTFHIQVVDDVGVPLDRGLAARVEASLPALGIEPITREAPRLGPGHFHLNNLVVPVAGTWQVEIVVRVTDFDEARLTYQVPIG